MGNSETKPTQVTTKDTYFILQRLKYDGSVLDSIVIKHINEQEFELNYKLIGGRKLSEEPRIDTIIKVMGTQALRRYFEYSVKNLLTTSTLFQICPIPGPVMTIKNTDEVKLRQTLNEQLTLWFISHSIVEVDDVTENPEPTAPSLDGYTKL